jgi:hypothetical protein
MNVDRTEYLKMNVDRTENMKMNGGKDMHPCPLEHAHNDIPAAQGKGMCTLCESEVATTTPRYSKV